MIATRPTEEQIEQIAKDLAPDVVRIRFNLGLDWSEDPAIYFRVVLSDAAAESDRLIEVTRKVRARLVNDLGLSESDLLSYFNFRSQSEQAQLKEASWD
jgi:hypothetical protein